MLIKNVTGNSGNAKADSSGTSTFSVSNLPLSKMVSFKIRKCGTYFSAKNMNIGYMYI